MDRQITATFDQLLDDANYAAGLLLGRSMRSIDQCFGEGFAKKNPELVAAMLRASMAQYGVASALKIAEGIAENIKESIRDLAESVQSIGA